MITFVLPRARRNCDNSLSLRGGKHIVVVVVPDVAASRRHWVVTAYRARQLTEGAREWTKSSSSNMTVQETFFTLTQCLPMLSKRPKNWVMTSLPGCIR